MQTQVQTLLDFLMDLLTDADALAEFREDPQAALEAAGLDDICLQDVQEILPVVLERIDAQACARYEDDCDDEVASFASHHGHASPAAFAVAPVAHEAHHGQDLAQVISHLTYVTNNFSFTDNSTFTDNSSDLTNNIWADGDVDVTQVGTGGSFIGGDNNGAVNSDGAIVGDGNEVVSGDGNVIGDGNQISGEGSTTSFGDGDATSVGDVSFGDGTGIAVGDGAVGNDVDVTLDNVGSDNSTTDNSDNSVDSSDNSDNSTEDNSDNSIADSGNGNTAVEVGDVDADVDFDDVLVGA